MSQSTRSLTYVLAAFRRDALHNGLTRKEMAQELRNLRMESPEFCKIELYRHFG